MPVLLQGLAVQFFRGIGPETQRLGPFKEFNFFVGSNNSGKSTILDLIHRHLSRTPKNFKSEKLDTYTGVKTGPLNFEIGVTEESFRNAVNVRFEKTIQGRYNAIPKNLLSSIDAICRNLVKDQLIWIKFQDGKLAVEATVDEDLLGSVKPAIHHNEWQNLWHVISGYSGASLQQWISQTVNYLFDSQISPPIKVGFIPTNRQIGQASEDFNDFSGRGLIDKLAQLQNPGHDKRQELALFEKINLFLQTVTGRDDAKIEIPHDRQHVLVHMHDKVLPLSNLGTGIHEVVMIAAFCTISERQIICIEEPESHLHPLLQRKLIAYLQANTSNQYFVATHSPSFIDTPGAAIFHVTNDGVQTRIKESVLRSERFAVCQDLGIRASDIVQSNFVIWVEGPSDRLYIRRWIQIVDPDLVEGIHYSIMFYGGRLLSHLTAEDDAVTEFIKLRSLNQHLCVIMDSDKAAAHSKINETKQRILEEFSVGDSMAWLTKGREIENYIQYDVLQSSLRKLYPAKYHSAVDSDRYAHALHYWPKAKDGKRGRKHEVSVDKVKVAKVLCEADLSLDVLDLKKQVNDLVKRIRSANV